jgi:hypothetical protein
MHGSIQRVPKDLKRKHLLFCGPHRKSHQLANKTAPSRGEMLRVSGWNAEGSRGPAGRFPPSRGAGDLVEQDRDRVVPDLIMAAATFPV